MDRLGRDKRRHVAARIDREVRVMSLDEEPCTSSLMAMRNTQQHAALYRYVPTYASNAWYMHDCCIQTKTTGGLEKCRTSWDMPASKAESQRIHWSKKEG